MLLRTVVFILAFVFTSSAYAQSELPSTGEMLLQVFGALLLIVSLIIGAGWLTKRFNLVNAVQGGELNVLASLTLGKKEKVVLVNACGKKLLLGVGANGVNFLHDLSHADTENQNGTSGEQHSQQHSVEENVSDKADFSSFLKNIISSNSSDKNSSDKNSRENNA